MSGRLAVRALVLLAALVSVGNAALASPTARTSRGSERCIASPTARASRVSRASCEVSSRRGRVQLSVHRDRCTRHEAPRLAMTTQQFRLEDGGAAMQRVLVGALACALVSTLIVSFGGPLSTRILIDVASGTLAAIAVTPFVALIDSAVAKSVAEKTPPTAELRRLAMEFARAPQRLLYRGDLYFTCLVYICTYLAANLCTTMGTGSLTRLVLVAGANMGTGVRKDAFIARTSRASGTIARAVPASTLWLFCARDINAIGASFVLPRLIAPHMATLIPNLVGHSADFACQLISPPLCELVNTPLHLLALDIFHRPSCSMPDRARVIARQYPRSVAVRLLRVMAAFSLGGIGNRTLRTLFLQMLGHGM
ncbi:hypothetical protein T492DRAFT_1071578 [Pavlovales sp. CCMP2436]|nr:hypothetical protein T492DRAFT_1071578 [Pavlovales sp. CCMP2436]